MREKITAKKSLGQNFLKNPAVIADIVKAASLVPGETVLEVGPGTGALTEALVKTAEQLGGGTRIIAVEKDSRLIAPLREKFAAAIKAGTLVLYEGDILTGKLADFGIDLGIGLGLGTYKIVANIPYYITGTFFRKFLAEETVKPTQIVAMIQKEVAERIVTRDKKESLLSLSVKAFGMPEIIRTVVRGNFVPMPNVDSAIISIKNISNPFATTAQRDSLSFEEFFFKLLHAGFSSKRKMLAGNLRTANIAPTSTTDHTTNSTTDDAITAALTKAGIELTARAEDIRLDQWVELAHILYSLQEGKGV